MKYLLVILCLTTVVSSFARDYVDPSSKKKKGLLEEPLKEEVVVKESIVIKEIIKESHKAATTTLDLTSVTRDSTEELRIAKLCQCRQLAEVSKHRYRRSKRFKKEKKISNSLNSKVRNHSWDTNSSMDKLHRLFDIFPKDYDCDLPGYEKISMATYRKKIVAAKKNCDFLDLLE